MSAAARRIQPLLLVSAIAAIAILLAFTSYQFFNDASGKVIEIAAGEDRTTARMLAHDLADSLSTRLEGIQQKVRLVAQAPPVQNKSVEEAKAFLDLMQQAGSDDDLADSYGWLDRDGRTIAWTGSAGKENPDYVQQLSVGADMSDRSWFASARDGIGGGEGGGHAGSPAERSPDGADRLFVSYPIIDSQTGSFEGVVYAGVPLEKVGEYLESRISLEKRVSADLVDMSGTVLHSPNPDLAGTNYLGAEYQAATAGGNGEEDVKKLQEFVQHALANPFASSSSGPDVADFTVGRQVTSVAYSHVRIGDGEASFAVVFTKVPHEIAADVKAFIDQQRFASAARIAVVGSAAVFIGALVIYWNRRLERTVSERTQSLAAKTDELVAANEQLKQNDKLQKEFINIAAHELRTPITPILTSIDTVRSVRDSDGESMIMLSERYYDIILRNVKRLERLSSDILQAARIESGTFRLGKEKFGLGRLIENVIADANNSMPESKKKGIRIEFESSSNEEGGEAGDLVIEADQSKLYEVLTNLVQNAIRFTAEGRITITAEKSSGAGEGNVIVRVKDMGSGIAPDILPRLFQKFASASSPNNIGGTGLGLYISKAIIEAHGGRIWAENNADGKGGATFSFSIPLSKS
ncbi:sensor histidine kinase [Nitrososphaera sp.]|uniref:sensor histidine kinase n=1 Tax=Nitrososphaera sp. TaxID=1971748 RepID=UPI00307D8C4D